MAALACTLLLIPPTDASGQAKATKKVFLVENRGRDRWCAYNKESAWRAAVNRAEALTVGVLIYAGRQLRRIDVTETDESGDWTAYDHYLLNGRGEITRLYRMINILPGNRSVSQTYLINDGKAKKTAATEKQLSSGKPLISAKPVWLPKVPIRTRLGMFPFSSLLGRPGLTTASKSCAPIPGRGGGG
ncbi:MAG: hypothetical protein ACRD2F_03940 [Terriglobales bacterium]